MPQPVSRRLRFVLLLALTVVCSGGNLRAVFTDVSATAGIDYTHAPTSNALAWSTAPAAAVDVNGDGWTDVVVGRAESSCLVFINQGNGRFVDESSTRGVNVVSAIGGIAAGDFDNDGDQDLFLVPMDGPRCYLLINDGTGHFTEQAVARGADLTLSAGQTHRGRSIGVVDFDRDGYLDLQLTEYNIVNPGDPPRHAVLLRNRGAAAPGQFDNVTAARGLTQPRTGTTLWGFSSGWADFDKDGWPDLALVVDFGQSQFYWNEGGTAFQEGAHAAGLAREENGMGVAIADVDRDGNLDLFVTSIFDQASFTASRINSGNKLYRNLGGRRFAEIAGEAGVRRSGWGWGAAFFDPDNDGDADLLVTNGQDFGWGNDPRASFQGSATDPTTFYQNDGKGGFANASAGAGITDRGLGRAVVVADFDRDGDEDVLITQAYGKPILYRNDRDTTVANHWVQFTFTGTTSPRDGFGAEVRIMAGGQAQTLLFQPSNSFVGQREAVLHVGLGAADSVTALEVTWSSGIVQTVSGVAIDQRHRLVEPARQQAAPSLTLSPSGGTWNKDSPVVLRAAAGGDPRPVYSWFKDGEILPGATSDVYAIKRLHPLDAGAYTVRATNPLGTVESAPALVAVTMDPRSRSVARWWNEALLDAIRVDTPNPSVHARNLYHLSAAMWDAYWPYEAEGWTRAAPVFARELARSGGEAAQREAISRAAYGLLRQRFAVSPGSARSLFEFRWLMQQLGFDPDDATLVGDSPAAVGNRIARDVLAATRDDGANEAGHYADVTGYTPRNAPLVVSLPGAEMTAPSHWQPLALAFSVTQNGIVIGESVQSFVGVNALGTTPFALAKPTATTFMLDPGPPPRLGGASDQAFKASALAVIEASGWLDPADGVMVDISPGARLNNPLGSNAGAGHALNPATGRPYAPNVVNRADYTRVLAEFWADGPASETPPGHWNVLFNEVSAGPDFPRRFAGRGAGLPPLAWDIRGYLALNGAMHDAACLAWGLKWIHDSARPISMIRYMGGLGQSSAPGGPSYHADGLPLVPGLVEIVTAESSVAGQRHALLAEHVGEVVIRAWQGEPENPAAQTGGVGWIRAVDWVPYQLATFVSPGFPGYVSGHSTFSRAGAEVMTLLTGSPFFPGGLGVYGFSRDAFLRFEAGPSADMMLQWATYYDAADQAGRSRIFGGIHIEADDFEGRRIGSRVGLEAFLKAQALRDAGSEDASRGLVNLSTRARAGTGDDVTIAGFVVGGGGPQSVLLRNVGPSLLRFGILDCDLDPKMELHAAGQSTVLTRNDDWGSSNSASAVAARGAAAGAFALDSGGRDAAAVSELAPGAYTMVTGSNILERTGIALAEVYGEHLQNLSTRAKVTANEGVVIAGFTLEVNEPAMMLIRGIGPGLATFGVAGTLGDPRMVVYRQDAGGGTTEVGRSDNWGSDDRASLVQDAAAKVGAFALENGSRDAATVLQLGSGSYTVVLSGVGETEGVGLIEVYHVQ